MSIAFRSLSRERVIPLCAVARRNALPGIVIGFCLVIAGSWMMPAFALDRVTTARQAFGSVTPFYLVRRVIVFSAPELHSSDVPVQKLLARQSALLVRRHRRKGQTAAAPAGRPFSHLPMFGKTTSKPKEPRDPDLVVPEDRPALAQGLLCDALADRLHDRAGVLCVPDSEVQTALHELGMTPLQAVQPQGAQRLCARLGCQALLTPHVRSVTVHDHITRDAVLYAVVSVTRYDAQSQAYDANIALPYQTPIQVQTSGEASVGHTPFRATYEQSQAGAIRTAAQQAALQTIHALWTGQSGPFDSPQARIAVTPVSSPEAVDALRYTMEGRHVQAGAVRSLPRDVSELFTPDLLPIEDSSTVTPVRTRLVLQAAGVALSTLWVARSEIDAGRVQEIGRRLGVDYVLVARVTDIEMYRGPEERLSEVTAQGTEQEAWVETIGALVRVSDGVVLWQDRATATMTAHPWDMDVSKPQQQARRVIRDATRFALVDLSGRLRHYLDSFAR